MVREVSEWRLFPVFLVVSEFGVQAGGSGQVQGLVWGFEGLGWSLGVGAGRGALGAVLRSADQAVGCGIRLGPAVMENIKCAPPHTYQ